MFYYTQKNVLTNEQCDELIEKSKQLGFTPAKVQYYGEEVSIKSIRNNSRLELEDIVLANQLEKILLEKMGKDFPYNFKYRDFKKLNDHFRIYAYEPGEYFKPHKDGHIKITGMESLITVLFYLNDTQGGETIIMPKGYADKASHISITPQKGSVLLFDHNIFHEGKTVISGQKYVLRSDLFFD